MTGEGMRVILGIDPGTNVMGYGVVCCKGNKLELKILDVLSLSSKMDHYARLNEIFRTTLQLIAQFKPAELAVESQFYGKNVQSMLKLGRAQGVVIAAALHKGVSVSEYSPRRIKQSITGKGNASKQQVAAMLQHIFSMNSTSFPPDATDGLAVAVCHYLQGSASQKASAKNGGWKSFISQNPDRVF